MTKKKKHSLTGDIADLTALNVGATVGISTMYSLPATPQVPLVESAKAFSGRTISLAPVLKGTGSLLRNLKTLEKMGKKQKRRK